MRVELSSAPPEHQRCGSATFNRGFVAALPAAGEEILRARSDHGVVTSDVDGNYTTEGGGVIGELAGHRVERDIHGHSDS
jgi:hypothetical protein